MAIITSPLRYPGGKSSLSIFFVKVLEANNISFGTYVEPYAGGAGAGLNLLLSGAVRKLVINDSDLAIYSIWWALLNDTDNFLKKLNETPVTIEEWKTQKAIYKNKHENSISDLGFAAFFLNRCNRSGILKANPIGGILQTGKWLIDARFNRKDLTKRIERVASVKSNIEIHSKDAMQLLVEITEKNTDNVFVYLDPPYYDYGQELYHNSYKHDDHKALAQFIIKQNKLTWLITYDNHVEIKNLYSACRLTDFSLNYFAHKKRKGCELLITPWHVSIPQAIINPQYSLRGLNLSAST